MVDNINNGGALGWDDEISQESSYILLPEGEYDFVVEKMERGQFQPSPNSKINEACPEAELTLKIQSPEGEATVFERLILHSATEWKLSEFFISIGQKIKGQPFKPNWSQVPGSRGRAKIEINKYTNKQGQDRENNRVDSFLEPTNQPQQQPAANQQPNQTQQPNNNPEFNF
ncbi:DUF669 domain-containing protein [Marinilactibacillus psychrotolerans]|uniref:DUF669 domain-containing protein n=1 Tax=Marinilactibacillus psychrotolerans TaxID=191770 RepID=A0A5R9BTE8_9LACT|nr:DUF669 domain-containing protein [Marinilactibacillus psychrotolerans]TLQ03944.1 DUF669 domain-containing protein [Marinilactibacillus psychrotolerans]